MHTALLIAQIVTAILVALLILIQDKGTGMGEAIGGTGGGFQNTKRGAEKILSQTTIVMVFIFMAVSLALNFL